MEKYFLIRTDGSCDVVELDGSKLLDELYRVLDCEGIESVPITENIIVILDDCGKIDGKRYNQKATGMLLCETGELRDYLFGDVILATVGVRDGEPDICPLPDDVLSLYGNLFDVEVDDDG